MTSFPTAPTPERGGRHKRIYELTGLGRKALFNMHSVGQAMWSGVTPVALDKELNTTDLPRPPLIAAWPLGWYLMNNWLTEFVYRIEIEWPLLASTGLLALLLTLVLSDIIER